MDFFWEPSGDWGGVNVCVFVGFGGLGAVGVIIGDLRCIGWGLCVFWRIRGRSEGGRRNGKGGVGGGLCLRC